MSLVKQIQNQTMKSFSSSQSQSHPITFRDQLCSWVNEPGSERKYSTQQEKPRFKDALSKFKRISKNIDIRNNRWSQYKGQFFSYLRYIRKSENQPICIKVFEQQKHMYDQQNSQIQEQNSENRKVNVNMNQVIQDSSVQIKQHFQEQSKIYQEQNKSDVVLHQNANFLDTGFHKEAKSIHNQGHIGNFLNQQQFKIVMDIKQSFPLGNQDCNQSTELKKYQESIIDQDNNCNVVNQQIKGRSIFQQTPQNLYQQIQHNFKFIKQNLNQQIKDSYKKKLEDQELQISYQRIFSNIQNFHKNIQFDLVPQMPIKSQPETPLLPIFKNENFMKEEKQKIKNRKKRLKTNSSNDQC